VKEIKVKETLTVENPVHFPEFVFLLLKAIHFIKHNITEDVEEIETKKNVNSQGEDIFQVKLARLIDIHANDEEMTDFQRHMLFSAPLIELLRVRFYTFKNKY